MQFGSDIVFTYGPLGFLTLPIPYFAATWGLSVVYTVILRLALCVGLATMLRRSMGLPVSIVVAFVVAAVSRDLGAAELALALFVAAGVRLLSRDHPGSGRLEQGAVAVGGALAGIHLLVKLNTGVFMILIGATTAWVIGRGRWRSEAVFGASAAVALMTGWMLTGHHLSGLSLYFRLSWQVAAGTRRRWAWKRRVAGRNTPSPYSSSSRSPCWPTTAPATSSAGGGRQSLWSSPPGCSWA